MNMAMGLFSLANYSSIFNGYLKCGEPVPGGITKTA